MSQNSEGIKEKIDKLQACFLLWKIFKHFKDRDDGNLPQGIVMKIQGQHTTNLSSTQ